MPRPFRSYGALLCCFVLLLESSSISSPSAAAGTLLPERDTTATATTAAVTSSSSPSSSTAQLRRLGGVRAPASLGSSFSSKQRQQQQGENENHRRSSFSVIDAATAPRTTAAVATTATPTAAPLHLYRRRRRGGKSQPPTIDIYVRTFSGDAAWLTWLLRSVEENVAPSAFRKLIISVPRGDAQLLKPLLRSFRLPIVLLIVDDAPFERASKAMSSRTDNGGYHAQMFDKLTRPPIFSDADFFVHVDSDCVFKRQLVNEEEENGKKKKVYRKISSLDFVDARNRVRARRVAFESLPEPFSRWKRAAEGMLLEAVPHETMSCFPLVFPREVYGLVRDVVLERHGSSGDKKTEEEASSLFFQVLSQHLDDFGEFTALGHVLTTRFEKGKKWISDFEEGGDDDEKGEDRGGGSGGGGGGGGGRKSDGAPRPTRPLLSSPTSTSTSSFCALAQQAWSWSGVTPEAAVEAEKSLRVGW